MQNLYNFKLPEGFRGKSMVYVQLWWLVQATLFRCSPQFAYNFRAFLLRLFGAKVGLKTVIRPTATITYPWKVEIGDYSWIGDDVVLYSLGNIKIGANVVISQRSYLCAADHDYKQADFPIRSFPIIVEDQAWLATDVFVSPGVTIGHNSVIGARSSVFKSMPAGMVCMGSPCRVVKKRE
ncbi:colanic acid biosynthesis acetyltransferase WcaF [Iodobacter sp. HSC-16F04]|uniref:Colanic acid biosynthesis acetyltransferase WcaF n=1 Tax=Iodobacter violaceini TaxID=3044271 RepID=A0ABX0L1W4_9NEIS|nr:putative colanic acid biosynthesis acetyltransferase [Iodobacter violacea]NHQ88512.1 colanic acid biosynthesis acetyltransferase WcaF [Iodobacter violacea]